jgi:hypothetical protein
MTDDEIFFVPMNARSYQLAQTALGEYAKTLMIRELPNHPNSEEQIRALNAEVWKVREDVFPMRAPTTGESHKPEFLLPGEDPNLHDRKRHVVIYRESDSGLDWSTDDPDLAVLSWDNGYVNITSVDEGPEWAVGEFTSAYRELPPGKLRDGLIKTTFRALEHADFDAQTVHTMVLDCLANGRDPWDELEDIRQKAVEVYNRARKR